MSKNIAVLVGSNSQTSFSQLVFKYLQSISPDSMELNFIQIADLPLYDRDLDEASPVQYERFRAEIAKADAVLFIGAEHNGSMPAMIKNAIDVGSRPMGQSKWINKPCGIVTLSAGMSGGIRVADHLRTICSGSFINMPVFPFTASIGGLFNGVFNEQGEITQDSVKVMLGQFINGFTTFVEKF